LKLIIIMKKLSFLIAVLLATANVALAHSNTTLDPLTVRSWAAGCANCHGTNGRAEPGNESLAGANKDEMVKKMLDFKSGRRPATLMHQLAKGYSDEQIIAIAGYFAAQKK
jgi:cytochrome c553